MNQHTLDDIPLGTVFKTQDGILAIKSEYRYGARQGDQWLCILLASGEYAHFFNGNQELVEIVEVASLTADRDALRAVVSDMLSGLAYLRQVERIPYGFGIDRLEETGKAAIKQAERGDGVVE